jgi:glucose-1-phosphate thymidylyltransferase
MKIIVPMAGMGKRMRPHTLTVPKPLLPIAGKPIVQLLVEDIKKVCGEEVEEVAFVIGNFGAEAEKTLLNIASDIGAKGSIYYQNEALGTAHAILCAGEVLDGKVVVAFADTLFTPDFIMDDSQDGVIWVKKIEEDPSAFGVVKVDENNLITDFIEKPKQFVSDLAIIGIYYFKDGNNLKKELQYLIDKNITEKGELQLTNALENMKSKGMRFVPGKVSEWLDCGNKDATVNTNQHILIRKQNENLIDPSHINRNSIIVPPCYIGPGVELINSVIGPYASIGAHSRLENVIITNSIVQTHAILKNTVIDNSIIGNFAEHYGHKQELSIGDYSVGH